MQEQLAALREVKEFLDQRGVRHLVIGGVANAVWGRPRATQDADFKVMVGREKDWDDIEGVLARQGEKLDQTYILHWLEQFAEALERPDLVQRYKDLRRKRAD